MKYYVENKALSEAWNKVNENKVLFGKALRCETIKHNKKVVFLYVKLTKLLSFSTRFPKSGPTYRRQVVNIQHQSPQGQSVAKPGIPL